VSRTKVMLLALCFVTLLATQVSMTAFAHHTTDAESARKNAEEKTKKIEGEKREKTNAIEEAYKTYRIAFKAWKAAVDNYRVAVVSGDQTEIETTKNIMEEKLLEKNNAWEEYQKIKKENS